MKHSVFYIETHERMIKGISLRLCVSALNFKHMKHPWQGIPHVRIDTEEND